MARDVFRRDGPTGVSRLASVVVTLSVALLLPVMAGVGNVVAAPTVALYADGTLEFMPNGDEWWACVAGSLAAPYLSVQPPQLGPTPQFARFTHGIDVGVACAGTGVPNNRIAIVSPEPGAQPRHRHPVGVPTREVLNVVRK